MLESDLVIIRQELRQRLFEGDLGRLAVAVNYQGKANGDSITVPQEREGGIISGRERLLDEAMISYADAKLDMATGTGHQRDNLLRLNRALSAIRDTASPEKASQIAVLTDALVRDVLKSHGIDVSRSR